MKDENDSERSSSTRTLHGGFGTLTHVSVYCTQFYYQVSNYSGTSLVPVEKSRVRRSNSMLNVYYE
jgi:hypothetical protein